MVHALAQQTTNSKPIRFNVSVDERRCAFRLFNRNTILKSILSYNFNLIIFSPQISFICILDISLAWLIVCFVHHLIRNQRTNIKCLFTTRTTKLFIFKSLWQKYTSEEWTLNKVKIKILNAETRFTKNESEAFRYGRCFSWMRCSINN